MIEFLKILHFIAFAGGVGASLAGLVVLRAAAGAPAEEAKVMRGLAPRIGMVGVHSLVLLWITGPLLLWLAYDGGGALGPLFHAKMAGAVLLTLVVVAMRLTIRRIRVNRPAPLAPHMMKLALAGSLLGMATIALAVLAFA